MSGTPSFWEELSETCLHMLWPVSCPICGRVGKLACGPCLRSLFKPQLPRCLWCGEAVPCKVHGEDRARIRAGSLYEGRMKELILMLKYGRYRVLGVLLGQALGEFLPRPEVDVLIPVPLHLKSKRSYNQAKAVAAGMGKIWGIEVWEAARWALDVGSHAGMGSAERQALSADAFVFDKKIFGLRIGLVDDVATTGATLSRLAAAARRSGAEVVGAFVVAHVPPID